MTLADSGSSGWVTPSITLAAVLIGSLLTGVITWLNGNYAADNSFQAEKYSRRLMAYQALWACTMTLRRTPDSQDLTRAAIQNVVHQLDLWYFSSGGLLLTEESRSKYFSLVNVLQEFVASNAPAVDRAEYVSIYNLATSLRNATAEEVGGRERTPLLQRRM